jgi:hypothetical protein
MDPQWFPLAVLPQFVWKKSVLLDKPRYVQRALFKDPSQPLHYEAACIQAILLILDPVLGFAFGKYPTWVGLTLEALWMDSLGPLGPLLEEDSADIEFRYWEPPVATPKLWSPGGHQHLQDPDSGISQCLVMIVRRRKTISITNEHHAYVFYRGRNKRWIRIYSEEPTS